MIITESKPLEEILKSLSGNASVFIAGCAACASKCGTGDEKAVAALADSLAKAGKRVTGSGILDVTLWRQRDSMTVHLVNLTNPMMMKGPVRELIPISAQRVRVRLPEGCKARAVHLLVSGRRPQVRETDGWLALSIESILDHEVIAIDL